MGFFNDKKPFDRKWIAGDEEHDEALAKAGVTVECASRVKARPTSWLVKDVIPDEGVTLVAGEPGAGKSFLACQLAADAARELKHRVLLATAGYESAGLIRWRLDQAEGDARRIVLATLEPRDYTDRRQNRTDELIDELLAILDHTLDAIGDRKSGMLPAEINLEGDELGLPEPPKLLVIDDIDGWFGKPGNMLSPAALGRVIQRLGALARAKRVAIVLLARLQLSVEGRITARQLSRISHAASVVWLVARDRAQGEGEKAEGRRQKAEEGIENCKLEEETTQRAYSQSDRRWFLPVKNNLASDAAALGRAFELVDGRVVWRLEEPPPTLAEALLPSTHNTDRRRQRNVAAEWLKEALADGPVPSKALYQQAIECGFSQGTVQRAATELGIQSHKTGFNGGWELRWTPKAAVRGRGARLRAEGGGFKIYGSGEGGAGKSEEGGIENCKLKIANCKLNAPEGCVGERPGAGGMPASRESEKGLEASQVEVAAAERNSPCSSEDAQLESEGAHVEGVGERNSPCLSEGTQLKVEDAQGERTVRQPNSPHLSEGAQLENEGAQDGPPPEKQPPQNIYAVLVEALQEAC